MKLALAITCILFATDGDSMRLCNERIRLVGFDAPELHSPRCPDEFKLAICAHDRLNALIDEGRKFGGRLERTGRRDKYNRTLARLYVQGRDVAGIMIEEGLARAYDGQSKRKGWCR